MGAVVCLGVLVAAGGCSDTVSIDSPALHGADAAACRALVRALPARVDDQARRKVQPADAYGAAWGDPPIVLRCGVGRPTGFDKFSTCQVANGVGWFIPDDEMTGRPTDIVMTTVGRAQNVEVRIPADYFPPAAAMADLAPAVKSAIREVRPCV